MARVLCEELPALSLTVRVAVKCPLTTYVGSTWHPLPGAESSPKFHAQAKLTEPLDC